MNLHFRQKTRSLAIPFLLGCAFCTACVQEPDREAQPTPQTDNPYYVPVDKALAALDAFEGGHGETRTAEREVSTVEVLSRSAVVPQTRAGEVVEDAPLAYIVNFQGGGYAVLGADTRQNGVIALVEKGSLGAETLATSKQALDTAKGAVDLHTYIHGTTVTALLDLQETPQTRYIPDEGDGPIITGGGINVGFATTIEYQAPLLKTEWTQWAPYNTKCSWIEGREVPVGCHAQALAQVVIYNRSVHGYGSITLGGPVGGGSYTPTWYLLEKAIETPVPAWEYMNEVSNLLYWLGVKMQMTYSPLMSIAKMIHVIPFLQDYLGYKNVSYKPVSMDDIRQLVWVKKAPIEVDGGVKEEYHSENLDLTKPGNHIWVVDGWQKLRHEMKIPIVNTTYYTYSSYVHCRFGYAGELDGWYLFDGTESTHKVYFAAGEIYYTLK